MKEETIIYDEAVSLTEEQLNKIDKNNGVVLRCEGKERGGMSCMAMSLCQYVK